MKNSKKVRIISFVSAALVLILAITLTIVFYPVKTIDKPAERDITILAEYLRGKNVSILGDSISTYEGYTDNPSYNSTLSPDMNLSFYKSDNKHLSSVNDTWWMRVINDLDFNLLVNNSCGGLHIYGTDLFDGVPRADNLHRDTGNLSGTTPDIVFVYLGTNDTLGNCEVGTFEDINADLIKEVDGNYVYAQPTNVVEAYAIILHKIKTLYNNPDIFCLNVLQNPKNSVQNINCEIAKVATQFGASIVDISNGTGITKKTLYRFTGDKIHPNKAGMKLISYALEHAMIAKYL